jgi:hypothetical protein
MSPVVASLLSSPLLPSALTVSSLAVTAASSSVDADTSAVSSTAEGGLVLTAVALSFLATNAPFGPLRRLLRFLPPRQPISEVLVVPETPKAAPRRTLFEAVTSSGSLSASHFLFRAPSMGDDAVVGGCVGAIVFKARTKAGVRSLRIILTGRSDSSKSFGALRFMVAKREGMVTRRAGGIVSDVDNSRISLIVETYWTVCRGCYCVRGKEDALLSGLLRIVFATLQVCCEKGG